MAVETQTPQMQTQLSAEYQRRVKEAPPEEALKATARQFGISPAKATKALSDAGISVPTRQRSTKAKRTTTTKEKARPAAAKPAEKKSRAPTPITTAMTPLMQTQKTLEDTATELHQVYDEINRTLPRLQHAMTSLERLTGRQQRRAAS